MLRAALPILASAAQALGASTYDLRPGDHLVFRQTLERDVLSPEARAVTRFSWTSHVLVLARREDRLLVGVQRNRDAGELVRYSEKGRDRSSDERPAFAEQLAKRGRAFSEANRFTLRGERLLPWAVVREGTSELLPSLHELPPLPPSAEPWSQPSLFGLRLAAQAQGACRRVSGEGGALRIAYSVCEDALESLELQGSYDSPLRWRIQERIAIERLERRRGEEVAGWLDDPDTRQAVISAWHVAETPPFDAAALRARLGRDAGFDRRLQAALARYEPLPPPAEARDAALLPIVRAVFGGGELPEWNCAVPERAERGLRLRRASLQVPGTTLRVMRSAPFSGRPYLLHVPEDYRGERPWPLVILLAGGPGRAVPMAQGLHDVLAKLDALVLMPDALGEMWWSDAPTQAFASLLREAMMELHVDPNRVTLSGFSNGGTGALLYATLWPDRFAAVASLMGAGVALFEPGPPLGLRNVVGLPMLFLHGDRDAVIPKSASEQTVKALRRIDRDAPVTLEILKGRGHDVTAASDDGRSLRFLEDKRRAAFPRRVVFETRNPGRRDFVEVVGKKGGLAEVAAVIGADDVVRVTTKRVEGLKLLLRSELFSGRGSIAVEIDGRRRFEGPLLEDCTRLLSSWRLTADPFRAWANELSFDLDE